MSADSTQKIKQCCHEGNKIFDEFRDIVEKIMSENDFVEESESNIGSDNGNSTKGSLNIKKLQDYISLCTQEKNKLSGLEFVVVVMGTMKAGKSTTINAIVGDEILPNRNTAMTTLPTRIRHSPGKKDVDLIVPNADQLSELLTLLKPKLKTELEERSKLDENTREIYEGMIKVGRIKEKYEGAEGVRCFLQILNDLARICQVKDVEFPYEKYSTLEELPLIEVEFAALTSMSEQTLATFTILDTPGPNEAGQTKLEGLVEQQIQNASGIILVLNYTQLDTEADKKMRDGLRAFAEMFGDKIYVLANKFDQENANSMDESATKDYVANRLLATHGNCDKKSLVKKENVYPVSSFYAYLVGRMRKMIEQEEVIPDYGKSENAWFKDFANAALGGSWKKKLKKMHDLHELQEDMEELWEDSLFQAPLVGVVNAGYANAAKYAIESASDKLLSQENELADYVRRRVNLLKSDISNLEAAIRETKQELESMEEQRKTTKSRQDKIISQLADSFEKEFSETQQLVYVIIDEYFKEGKVNWQAVAQKQTILDKLNNKKKWAIKKFFDFINPPDYQQCEKNKKNIDTYQNDNDFDAGTTKLIFNSEVDARNFMNKITSRLKKIFTAVQNNLEQTIEVNLDSIDYNILNPMANEANTALENFTKKLGKQYDIRITFPPMQKKSFSMTFDVEDFLYDSISPQNRPETHRRRQTGIWGWICEKFNTDDWGWETYTANVTEYVIYIEKVKNQISNRISSIFQNVKDAVDTHIQNPLAKQISDFYNEFDGKLRELKIDFENAIKTKENDMANIDQLIGFGKGIEERLSNLNKRTQEMKICISEIVNNA